MADKSFLRALECSQCGRELSADSLQTFCQDCQAPLLARYDLAEAALQLEREQIQARRKGMWRYRELLPVQRAANIISLGEGGTPLLRLPRVESAFGYERLYLKDESLNPTGTFKARGLSAAVSRARDLGVRKLMIPTAGNAGGALAAYAARAGLQAAVFMPRDTPPANIEESRICAAEVVLVDGLIHDAAARAHQWGRDSGWFDVSTFKEPYRMEGKKTMGYEIAEDFAWQLPDVILYPAGGGMGLVAIWKAFEELAALGWLETSQRPRMVAVQAEGCAPIVRAFERKAEVSEFWQNARTLASGLRVPKSFGDRLVLRALYESQGTAVAVPDEDILQAQRQLAAMEGIFAAPEGAALVAALPELRQSGWLQPEERILLLNTGTGLKYLNRQVD